MRIDFIELAGFRGVRDTLRLDLRDGFLVIAGRNGAGKSTVIDAIDFALSGTINRFSVRDAKGGGLEDHIWWMGEGDATAHYVTVAFVDDDGTPFVVTRDRTRGANVSTDDIVRRLSLSGTAPAPGVDVLIQTTIIRDELIAALSLDLPEQARFSAVRSALGAIAGPDYSKRTAAVLAATNALKDEQQKEIDRIQSELGRTLSALTEARSAAERSSDVAEAISVIRAVPELSPTADDPQSSRRWVASERQAIARLEAARLRSERLEARFDDLSSGRLAAQVSEAERERAEASRIRDQAAQALDTATALVAAERSADEYAAHLSALAEHGAIVGLHEGHCPLCDAARTQGEFDAGIAKARARLIGRGERLKSALDALDRASREATAANAQVDALTTRLEALSRTKEELEGELSAIRDVYIAAAFEAAPERPADARLLLLERHERVARVERALFVLEASTAIDHVKTLEAKVASLKEQAERAASRLSEVELGVENARQIDATGRTVANQMLEEQFDTVMPLLKELYRRLRPHPDWLDIEADFGGRVRASLNFVVGGAGNPQFLFSSGQRRAAGLAFLLAIHLSRTWCRWNTLVMDDPVQHIDDYRALNLAEVLSAVRRTGRQVIVAVEDQALADLLCRRLRSTAASSGHRVDLKVSPTGATELVGAVDVAPLPHQVLRQAKAS